jgi:hypothetical protein
VNKSNREPKIVNWPSLEGSPLPLGVTYIPGEQAYNFALYSKNATEVTLLLYNKEDCVTPFIEVWLEPLSHKTNQNFKPLVITLIASTDRNEATIIGGILLIRKKSFSIPAQRASFSLRRFVATQQ